MEPETIVSEEAEKYLKQAEEGYRFAVEGFARDFKEIDAKGVLYRLISGKLPEMLEVYVECMNEAALMRGRGMSLSSKEYQEMERLIQQCEHWIADRVLKSNGWEYTSVTMYHKKR